MKKQLLILLAALALLLPGLGFGQTATTSTTLSAAVTDTSTTTIVVASATGVTANQTALYIDRELLFVNSVSGTTLGVTRGYAGTRSMTHKNAATVYVGAPNQVFIGYPKFGTCTATNEQNLPQINVSITQDPAGALFDCYGGDWQFNDNLPRYSFTLAPNAPRSAGTAVVGATTSLTAQAGGAQSATTSNGGAGGVATFQSGAGGAGGSSSGTGGAGGALNVISGAGAGTVTGGAGGLLSVGGGAGGNGSSAGGTGGGLNIYSGAAGSGGTGTSGAINIRSGGAAGTAVFSASTAGATTVQSAGTNQTLTLNGSGTGKVTLADGTDATKKLIVDPSGASTATATTLAVSQTVARTLTLPDNTGGVPVVYSCGSTGSGNQSCTPAAANLLTKIYNGQSTLSSNAATITFAQGGFTSTTSFMCVANDVTTRANPVQMVPASATTATITDTTGASDVIQWVCIGQ